MDCEDCNHKEHEAGKRKQCNCGESLKVHPQGRNAYVSNYAIPGEGYELPQFTQRTATVVPKRHTRYEE
jgi:hypothetical protein